MMKSLLGLVAGLWLLFLPAFAAETPGAFKPDVDYDLIDPPLPTDDPSKIEVKEFFSYGCSHCYEFEPDLNAWLKKKPDSVAFLRQPVAFGRPQWATYARIYLAAEALGVVDKVQPEVYKILHVEKKPLQDEGEIADLFVKQGVSKADFNDAYQSFSVDMKVKQSDEVVKKYGVDGTPTLIVNGKYRVSPTKAKSFSRMIEITNALIRQESGQVKAPK